jgi:alpha-beta hydrolase superfamily lysophospholipase
MISRVLSRVLPGLGLKTGLDATTLSRNPAVVQAYQDDPLVHGVGTPRLATESMAAIEWTLAHAANWNLPLLLLHGGADRLVPIGPSRAFFDQVPIADKRMIEYPDGYHEPHNDTNHEQVTADLEQWLAQHMAAGS